MPGDGRSLARSVSCDRKVQLVTRPAQELGAELGIELGGDSGRDSPAEHRQVPRRCDLCDR